VNLLLKKYNLGIDIGGTSIKIGKFDLNGNLIDVYTIPTNINNHGEEILTEIVDLIKSKIVVESIRAIGIGVPGPVSHNIVYGSVNLGWGLKDIVTELKTLLNDNTIFIKVGNDANLAAAGEIYRGVASGYRNAFMVTLGTGIGGGLIIDGKVVDGINGAAGEVGHTFIDDVFNLPCNCGKSGCLETVSSATGIVRLAKAYLDVSDKPSKLRNLKYFSAKRVIDLAKTKDELAVEVFSKSMEYLGKVFAKIAYIVNPDVFIIGGGISNAGDFVIKEIEKYYYPLVKPFINYTDFRIASLGNQAGMFGACYLVL